MATRIGRVPVGSRWSSVLGENIEMARLLIKCDCGRELVCQSFTNSCTCGREYNACGQELAPREQWGEETGETAADLSCSDDELVRWLDGKWGW